MKTVYLSSAYFAPIEYYSKLFSYDKIFIEQSENYVKQTYRNRCVIAAANGTLTLSIPIERQESTKCLFKDIQISDHGNWRHIHWNAIETAYKNSPFFDYYEDDFRIFFENKYNFLFDFNEELRTLICRLIDIQPNIEYTTEYKQNFNSDEDDFRDLIHPKKEYSSFDTDFNPAPYYQVFIQKHGFIPNLSIIDLLFNMGPESLIVLKDSTVLP